MLKYRDVMSKINIVPSLFARITDYAMMLNLKGSDLCGGYLARLKPEYTGAYTNYPLKEPFKVPQRLLPSVDVYVYKFFEDLEFLKKCSLQQLRSYILIQAENDVFLEEPEVENAYNDYYAMFPQIKVLGEFEFTNKIEQFPEYDLLRGDYITFERMLHVRNTGEAMCYYIKVFLEAGIYDATSLQATTTVVVWIPQQPVVAPTVQLNLAGHQVPSNLPSVWVNTHKGYLVAQGVLQRVSEDLTAITENVTFYNTFKVKIEVRPEGSGTTSPPVGEYEYRAYNYYTLIANPASGYVFDHWEIDGVFHTSESSFNFRPIKDCVVTAVFAET
jgi:hypothetical protein